MLLIAQIHAPVGVVLAVGTSVLWAISPVFMASVGRRIGSYPTNLLRVFIAATALAFIVLPAYLLLVHGDVIFPAPRQIAWITVSGLTGMVIGDACFYEAMVLLGPRRAVKLNTLAPVVALFVGWLVQAEALDRQALIGVVLVVGAVMYAAFARANETLPGQRAEPGAMTPFGLFCGIVSACCIAFGSVLMRQAFKSMPDRPLDSIIATVIRVNVAAVALWIIPTLRGHAPRYLRHLKEPLLRDRLILGTLFGALGGMLCYVGALKFSPAGLVSTIVATSPLVIIPLIAFRYRVRIKWGVVAAAFIAVAGVALISIDRKPASPAAPPTQSNRRAS